MTGNHYQTLEISHKSTHEEIKQAYRRLARQFHPDSQNDSASHDKIVAINAAYEILRDPRLRKDYDNQLIGNSPEKRAQRTATAQVNYHRYKEAVQEDESLVKQWYNQTYSPINRLIGQIIRPLKGQIDHLSADPFDDQLMAVFQDYLETCRQNLDRAKTLFSQRPNPAKMAKVAASLYYCLNHLTDGLEELETFTLNYDDRSLHTGQEMFRMAQRLQVEAKQIASQCQN
ncbi:MAG: molecular chaperone DnaJ [Microcystis panniformis Mp_MB_F_20051200_S9]|uniref:Molecular chaperone DnaJ n=1 Tax=Microcystis panniformis Mp_MB_F_20051200_S9 TaxID=2486223 RepID=A0A552PHZ0_9CHRO|nr:MAG: molecular chaperone DnaJ [Microcystis panniformis Mp_MB_F_20080800_S26D]TRV45837.1 MAG: molecular chaperone DnaJ [Microcystis panniformis Mp_GB_SS_20050300_S99D]TRV53377.1 MAG: molecular chaperone DnaJ [Microcystis panniformis Mp_GB_SS_20050300_S99]TRV56614.1 MAG: molecular chaperone DnaJ [Microcystis panniformis Mp_MB_F_20051200_S9]TRV64100.1 MAG: molecular chaperone DnaJ [Microcystis panniformis Mp_MB_F_20080800_S26]TRV64805.1 MAG: molecular chaperone DnaJ [Microcystis panniformis Mp